MDDNPLDMYTKSTKAWFPDEEEGWILGHLVTKTVEGDKVVMDFFIEARQKNVLLETTLEKLEASKYADLPPLKNPPILEGIDDLADLSYLHEPAVLHNIRLRYCQEAIYTYSGIVLVAMNPFKYLNIYTPDIMREYSGKRRGELEPHLFAVAEEAYRNMIQLKKNQSIIVSGESGAGKTQSAKYIMRYFAIVDDLTGRASVDGPQGNNVTEIEEAVLSTNPIMEAFGNAKTTRNDNSSRFGKYIEIMFEKRSDDNGARISGAKIRTYLLERSRLVFQPESERNYHIFYQLCAAAPAAERKELALDEWQNFFYLNQGNMGVVKGMDDASEFAMTQKSLSKIGISVSMQWDIFRVCAALLHIGNIKITDNRGEAQISSTDASLLKASELLGVDAAEFSKWIVKKQIITRSEKIVTNHNSIQALTARDSIAKFIYAMLFDWIVKIVNNNLAREAPSKNARFIGVLDIYGFEHFKRNSFEQFCINYANEKLQQEFNQHVFKLEQEEYVAEQIDWSFIDFNDNQPCIDMIENKLGLLDLLDEECRLPSGADDTLLTKIYQRYEKHAFFEKPRFGNKEFTVKHYACNVSYDINGFLEKNKDTVADEQLSLLTNSQLDFVKEIISIVPEEKSDRPGKSRKPTLGSIFKGSLIELMETIRKTEVHYIRCIKPNQAKAAFEFEPPMVLSQLRACGVLETIRISNAGYPSRWTFPEFADRYYLLVQSKFWKSDPKQLSMNIVTKTISNKDKYQMGLTKIFFRAGQLAYLEKLRAERLRECVVLIQKNMRRFVYQKRYQKLRKSTILIQAHVRGFLARRYVKDLREYTAAVKIQRNVRRWIAQKNYQRLKKATIRLQAVYRGRAARLAYLEMRYNTAVVRIQRWYRSQLAKKEFKKHRRLIILTQSCARRFLARKQFKQLKIEAKSVGKLKEVNYKLESKLVEVSQLLNAKNKEFNELNEKMTAAESHSHQWKEKFLKLEESFKSKATESSSEVETLKKALAAMTEERDNVQKEYEKAMQIVRKRDDEIIHLKHDIEKLEEESKRARAPSVAIPKEDGQVEALKKEIASLNEQMSKLVAGKYKADRLTEQYMNAEYTSPSSGGPRTPILNSRLPSFLESAAQATVQVAETLLSRGNLSPTRSTINLIPEDTKNKERPVRMLEAPDLEDEIIESLVINLRIPLPSTQSVATKKEIFFPAHLIGHLGSQLLDYEMVEEFKKLYARILSSIHDLVMKFEDDYVSAFWLSNMFELLSVLNALKEKLMKQSSAHLHGSPEMDALHMFTIQAEKIMIDIYYGWNKELKKRLSNMIIPAVVENQSLPGYICKQSGGGLFGKWSKPAAPQFTIDQLLNFLSKLTKTMKCYYMDDNIIRQILTELLRVIGVSAFNHLLMRKNFSTWKRGVQIQYNVSRLEEWAVGHGIPEGTLHLQSLLQAAKLLTLNKTSTQDIETIFDVCFLLNASQIKKLLSLYYSADFDSPLSPELLKVVTFRASHESSDTLLLDLDKYPEFVKPCYRNVKTIEKFIPSWVTLPHIQAILSLE